MRLVIYQFLCEKVSNLNEGTGNPCAGQDKLKGSEDGFSTVELFSPRLNMGADPPMGSKSWRIIIL